MMTDGIIEKRNRLVQLSKDPIETKELLDQLTEEEIEQANIKSHFHVGEKDIVETKDFGHYCIHRTKNAYLLHYYGGYSILVDENLLSPSGVLQNLMDGVPDDVSTEVEPETGMSEKDRVEAMLSASEKIFRLPLFVFSSPVVTLNIATMAVKYIELLQKIGEIPTEETSNPEYDKAIEQMNEFLENCTKGLEQEYENRKKNGLLT